MKSCLVIDAGGTAIKAGIVHDGRVLKWTAAPAFSGKGLAAQLPRLRRLLLDLCEQTGVSVSEAAGIGLCIPGLVDPRANRVVAAPKDKYVDAEDVDLPAWAKESFGLPLHLENDANAACLGEWRFGAGRGSDDLVMVTLGTGIGVSVVLRGRPLRGKHAQAGVLGGHFIVVPNGRPCGCGGHGCVEAEASSIALFELAQADLHFPDSMLARQPRVDHEAVFRAAAAGDRLALRLRERCLDYWGAHAVSLIHAFDPDRLIVGGGVARSADVIVPHVQRFIGNNAWTPWGRVEVVPAATGDQAGLLGMSVLLTEKLDLL